MIRWFSDPGRPPAPGVVLKQTWWTRFKERFRRQACCDCGAKVGFWEQIGNTPICLECACWRFEITGGAR